MTTINNTTNVQDGLSIPFWMKLNLTIKEAAAYSGIGEKTIRSLVKERACPFVLMIGNKHLIKRREFEKYIESRHFI